jgi:hypothetical protein
MTSLDAYFNLIDESLQIRLGLSISSTPSILRAGACLPLELVLHSVGEEQYVNMKVGNIEKWGLEVSRGQRLFN